MNAAVDVLDDIVLEIIERRRAEGGEHSDLLGTRWATYTTPTHRHTAHSHRAAR